MSLETRLMARANRILYETVWLKGQKLRDRLEKFTAHFFEELVTVGIDVPGPPSLGEYQPSWVPLSNSWVERKGFEEFYLDTGALDRALRRKSTVGIFGRPQVFLEMDGQKLQVTSRPPAQKYQTGKVSNFTLIAVPFPKVTDLQHVEEVVAAEGSDTYFKLINPKGKYFRPLVSPFLAWYLKVKIRQQMKVLAQ